MEAPFFTPQQQAVETMPLGTKTNDSIDVAEQIVNNNTSNSSPFGKGFSGNLNGLKDHYKEDIQEAQENPHVRNSNEETTEEPLDENLDEPLDENTEERSKQSPEFYDKQGKFIAEMTDIALPNGIAFLNGEKGEDKAGIPLANKYKAEGNIKKEIGLAWGRVLQEKAVTLSPTGQLIWAMLMGYGIPLGLSIWAYVKKLTAQKEAKDLLMMQTLQQMQQQQQQQPRQAPAPPPTQPTQKQPPATPQPAQQPIPTNQPKPEPFFLNESEEMTEEVNHLRVDPQETQETTKEEPENKGEDISIGEVRKVCINNECEKSFVEGKGYAKTKGTKTFDSYCSKDCMFTHIGKQSNAQRKVVKDKDN